MTKTPILVVLGLLSVLILGPEAAAQLQPKQLYFGIDRPFMVEVAVPEGLEGEPTVQLLKPVSAEVIAAEAVKEGEVDLASLFPFLWQVSGDPGFYYVQLAIGDTRVGPAIVLQPMVSPKVAQLDNSDPSRPKVVFQQMGRTFSGYRAYVDQNVVFDTTEGEIEFKMRPDQAPNSVWNFRSLVDGGYYTDVAFHRIMGPKGERPGFVIQVGDPTATGTGGPGYFIPLEDSKLLHDFGVLSMARSGPPDTGGSQVFVCLSREATRSLDGLYTAFAETIRGGESIMTIATVPVGAGNRPADPMPMIRSAWLVDSAPYGTGPATVREPASEPVDR